MNNLSTHLNEHVQLELKGKKILEGVLVYIESDIIVLYSLGKYVYVSSQSLHSIEVYDPSKMSSFLDDNNTNQGKSLSDTISNSLNGNTSTIDVTKLKDNMDISLPSTTKDALEKGKNKWIQLVISPKLQLIGKINQVKDDYISFLSASSQKEVFINLQYIQFFYFIQQVPFGLKEDTLLGNITTASSLPNTFINLISSFTSNFVLINGFEPLYIQGVNAPLIENVTKEGNTNYYHIQHVSLIQSI